MDCFCALVVYGESFSQHVFPLLSQVRTEACGHKEKWGHRCGDRGARGDPIALYIPGIAVCLSLMNEAVEATPPTFHTECPSSLKVFSLFILFPLL